MQWSFYLRFFFLPFCHLGKVANRFSFFIVYFFYLCRSQISEHCVFEGIKVSEFTFSDIVFVCSQCLVLIIDNPPDVFSVGNTLFEMWSRTIIKVSAVRDTICKRVGSFCCNVFRLCTQFLNWHVRTWTVHNGQSKTNGIWHYFVTFLTVNLCF